MKRKLAAEDSTFAISSPTALSSSLSLESVLQHLQAEPDPVKAVTCWTSRLSEYTSYTIESFLVSPDVIGALTSDVYWLFHMGGMLDFSVYVSHLKSANTLSNFLRMCILEGGCVHDQDAALSFRSSLASEICLFLFSLHADTDDLRLRDRCGMVLDCISGNYILKASQESIDDHSSPIFVTPEDLTVLSYLSLILLMANRHSALSEWMKRHAKALMRGIIRHGNSGVSCFLSSTQTAATAIASTSPDNVSVDIDKLRRIFGFDLICEVIRDVIHQPQKCIFDIDMRTAFMASCPLETSALVVLLLENVLWEKDTITSLATASLGVALREKNHRIMLRSIAFGDWVLSPENFERWIEDTIGIPAVSIPTTTVNAATTTTSMEGSHELIFDSEIASFAFFGMCEILESLSKHSIRILSKIVRNRRFVSKEAADIFLTAARARLRELDGLYNPFLGSMSASQTYLQVDGISSERITSWANSIRQLGGLPTAVEQHCQRLGAFEMFRAMQSLDLADPALRANCVIVAKAISARGLCSIDYVEEFEFVMLGNPTSEMSRNLEHLGVLRCEDSPINEAQRLLKSVKERINANEITPQSAKDYVTHWKSICESIGLSNASDNSQCVTEIAILSTLLVQLGQIIERRYYTLVKHGIKFVSRNEFLDHMGLHGINVEKATETLTSISVFHNFISVFFGQCQGLSSSALIGCIIETVCNNEILCSDLSRGGMFCMLFMDTDTLWIWAHEAFKVIQDDKDLQKKVYMALDEALGHLHSIQHMLSLLERGEEITKWTSRFELVSQVLFIIAVMFDPQQHCNYSKHIDTVARNKLKYLNSLTEISLFSSNEQDLSCVLTTLKHPWWLEVISLANSHKKYLKAATCEVALSIVFKYIFSIGQGDFGIELADCNKEFDLSIELLHSLLALFKMCNHSNSEFINTSFIVRSVLRTIMPLFSTRENREGPVFAWILWIFHDMTESTCPKTHILFLQSFATELLLPIVIEMDVIGASKSSVNDDVAGKVSDCYYHWVSLIIYLASLLGGYRAFDYFAISLPGKMMNILSRGVLLISSSISEVIINGEEFTKWGQHYIYEALMSSSGVQNAEEKHIGGVGKCTNNLDGKELSQGFLFSLVLNVATWSQGWIKTDDNFNIHRVYIIRVMGWVYGRVGPDLGRSGNVRIESLEDHIHMLRLESSNSAELLKIFLICIICGCLLSSRFKASTPSSAISNIVHKSLDELEHLKTHESVQMLIWKELVEQNVPIVVAYSCMIYFETIVQQGEKLSDCDFISRHKYNEDEILERTYFKFTDMNMRIFRRK